MLTHMIMFSQDYRAKAGQFIGTLASGQDTGAAFNAVYGRSLQQVLEDLRLYMKQSALADCRTRNLSSINPLRHKSRP